MEEFNIQAAWALFKNMQFTDSIQFFEFTNFDPREIIALSIAIVSLLGQPKMEVRIQSINTISKFTISYNIYIYIYCIVEEKRMKGGDTRHKIEEGNNAIIRLLESKREHIIGQGTLLKDLSGKPTFIHSYSSMINKDLFQDSTIKKPISLENILELIDTALLKMYIELKRKDKIVDMFKNWEILKCKYDLIERELKAKLGTGPVIIRYTLALFYEVYIYIYIILEIQ